MQQDQRHPLSPPGEIAPWCSQAWCCAALKRVSTTAYGHPSCVRKLGQSPGDGAPSPEQPSWWWIRAWHSPCAQTALGQGLGHELHTVLSWASKQAQHKDCPIKNSLEKPLKQLKSWERHGLGEEGVSQAGRSFFTLFQWLLVEIALPSALLHPALTHSSSPDVNSSCLQKGNEGKWSL